MKKNSIPPDRVRASEAARCLPQDEMLTSSYLDNLVDGESESTSTANIPISSIPTEKDNYEDEMKRRCGLPCTPHPHVTSRNTMINQDRQTKRIKVSECVKSLEVPRRTFQTKDIDNHRGKCAVKVRLTGHDFGRQDSYGQSSSPNIAKTKPEMSIPDEKKEDSKNVTPRKKDQSDAITTSDLQFLSEQTPDDTLTIIQGNFSKFSKLFSQSSLTKQESKIILKVMARVCKAERSTQHLLEILLELKDSKFIEKILPSVVEHLELASESDFLINIVVILQSFAFHFPSSFGIVFGLSSLIQGHADSQEDEKFLKEWGCFKELKHTMVERQEKEKEKVRIQKERRLRPQDDFRELSPFPNNEDVDFSCRAFLRKNKKYGGYEDDDDYLDTQFRLLKEDFVQPLRDGIKEHLEHQTNPKQRISIKVYTNVQVCAVVWSNDKILHKLKFEVNGKKVNNWEYNKRLIFGTLLCLSMDNFKTFLLATVGDSDRTSLENGYVNVEFQTRYEDVESIKNTTMFTMLETPAYFEAYKHVLITLQKMREVPFSDYIVHCKTECKKPRYLLGNDFDFEFLNKKPPIKRKAEENIDSGPQEWPCKESLNLNEAQYSAFKEALTKEFCIVQGPPGTGKTFLGLKIAETLLANMELWFKDEDNNSHPILLVCYTNHALDQFIEGVSKFPPAKNVDSLVRFGGRSHSSTVQKYNIKNRRSELFKENELRDLCNRKNTLYRGLTTFQQNIAQCGWQIGELKSGVVHEDVLKPFMDKHFPKLVERFNKRDTFPAIINWLGMRNLVRQSKPNKNKKCEVQSNFAVNEYFDSNQDLLKSKDKMFALILEDLQPKDDKDEKDNKTNPSEEEKPKILKRLSKKSRAQLLHDLSYKLQNMHPMNKREYTNVRSIWHLQTQDRWRMYFYWLQHLQDFLLKKKQIDLKEHLTKFDDKVEEYEGAAREVDYHILKKAKVIGMTTTGAARNHELLKKVNPRIVIIEEAAEVLESHTVSSLHPGCEHLILIGDHKQLKPNPNVYELAKRYNLDLSMFERMVTNGHRPNTLTLQHRMRPSISRLMRHIYTNLEDHPSVEEYPDIKGIGKNLFFINHHEKEKEGEDSLSHANEFEASYLARLCKYLLLQGYRSSQITVLGTYLAQVGCIQKRLQNMFTESNDQDKIHVTAVDNYQGEENDIILLSLVRSNDEDIVGFLKIENRICVALSRAKIGMYVIGNFDALQKRSELWKDLIKDVRESGEFGQALPLYCQNHINDGGIMATSAQDFDKAPEGGCTKKCEFRLNCGHVCHLKCHPRDTEHTKYKCLKPCLKTCEQGHSCKNKCHEDCNRCDVIITKCLPICKHLQDGPCHRKPEDEKCMHPCEKTCSLGHTCKQLCHEKCSPCTEIITKTIPDCGHTQDGECHLAPEKEKCKNPCEKKCENGHFCTNFCHEKCSLCHVVIEKILPKCNHTQEGPCHIKAKDEICLHPCSKSCPNGHRCKKLCHEYCGKCRVNVQKTLPICGHEVSAYCFESPYRIKCNEQCIKQCRFGQRCVKKCHEYCGKCPVEVEKVLPRCGHGQLIICSDDPFEVQCRTPCENILSCGHTCRKLCTEPCECKVFSLKRLKCGHDGRVPCGDKTKRDPDCTVPCKATLTCGHGCKGSCKKCLGGRLHVKCEESHECRLLCGHTSQLSIDGSWTSLCTKKCDFRCEHGSCKRKCMDRCTVMDCCAIERDQPCNVRCEGDHQCVGLLGYPCLDYCKNCNPEEYQKTIFGKRVREDEKYMQLKCSHILPVAFMDYWVLTVPNEHGVHVVGYKHCIYCSAPIKDRIRYYKSVKQTKFDIDRIVKKIYPRVDGRGLHPDTDGPTRINDYLYKRLKKVRHFLREICSREQHTRDMAVTRKDIRFLQGWLNKTYTITSQQQRDVEKEITRLLLLVLLLRIIDSNDNDNKTENEGERNIAHVDLDDNLNFNEDEHEHSGDDLNDEDNFDNQRNNGNVHRYLDENDDIDSYDETEEDEESRLNPEQRKAVHNAVRLLLRHGPLLPDIFHKVKKLINTLPGMADLEIEEVRVDDYLKPKPLVFGCWFKCSNGHLFYEGDPYNIPNPDTVACKECLG